VLRERQKVSGRQRKASESTSASTCQQESAARVSPVGFDLLLSYGVIGLFGMAVVIIGSRVQVRGQGTGLALLLAEQLAASLGISGKWIFLVGF